MYLPRTASRIRLKEAQIARNNRAEIVKALSQGEITRRDLFKWGIFTTTGLLVAKNGLSPFAKSAYAGDDIPTGTPPSPLFGAQPFSQPMPRLIQQNPVPLRPVNRRSEIDAAFPAGMGERRARRLSYHTSFSRRGIPLNPITGRGPMEGRPPSSKTRPGRDSAGCF